MMKEGTVSVPPYRPCAYSDDGVLPVRWLSHSGELKRRVKPHDQKYLQKKSAQ
jgi:hypothetical protein